MWLVNTLALIIINFNYVFKQPAPGRFVDVKDSNHLLSPRLYVFFGLDTLLWLKSCIQKTNWKPYTVTSSWVTKAKLIWIYVAMKSPVLNGYILQL